jgi:hypothetical protein
MTLMIAVLVIECIWMNEFTQSFTCTFLVPFHLFYFDRIASVDAPSPYPGFRGCFVTHVDRTLWKEYVVLTALEFGALYLDFISFDHPTHALVVVLAFMAISAFRSCPFPYLLLLLMVAYIEIHR